MKKISTVASVNPHFHLLMNEVIGNAVAMAIELDMKCEKMGDVGSNAT